MDVLIVGCARKNSKRLPNKHILPFCGKPLAEWTIEDIVSFKSIMSKRVDIDALVSSDSYEILGRAEHGGIDTRLRPDELALDDTPKLEALRDALNFSENKNNKKYDCLIDLDFTNPCRTAYHIGICYDIFKLDRPKTVISVVKAKKNPHFNQIEYCVEEDRYKVSAGTQSVITRGQDAPITYDINANIYIYDAKWLTEKKESSPVTDHTKIYVMPEWTRHDIDDAYDFFDCENNFREYILTERI